jgi:predicted ATP-grasp superfamily ATP-dependent carboligase
MKGITVLVLDSEAKTGPTTVRTLGREGARVLVAAPPGPVAPAQRSRYAAARLTHPDPLRHPDGLVDWLGRTLDEHHPDCVLPMTEYTIRALDRHRDVFADRTSLALPDSEALAIAFDKGRLLALAATIGVEAPKTWQPASLDEAYELAPELPYPVYVKARESYSSASKNPRFARGRFTHSPEDYRRLYEELDGLSSLPLVQETVPGHVFKVDAVYQNGEPVDLFCQEVYRTWPISGGYGVMRRSVSPEDAPARQAKQLMAALEWTGPAEVEFLMDERDGTPRLLEINGRFWASVEFAHYCGVPIAPDTVRVAMGLEPVGAPSYRVGASMRWPEGDLKRFYAALLMRDRLAGEVLRLPGRLETLRDLLWDSRPGVHQDDFYLDDPMPALALIARTATLGRKPTDPGAPPPTRD